MSEPTASAFGGICYIEIPAPNLAKAKNFYRTVFQWTVSDSDLGEAPYAIFQAAGIAGGFDSRKEAAESGVLLYLKVESIPSTLSEIERAGGRVTMAKTPVIAETDDYGFFATFNDPNGNLMGLWSKT